MSNALINISENLTINEIAEQLKQRLGSIYEEKWPGRNQPRVEAVKALVFVYYGPPGHRVTMTKGEALRFLDVIAEVEPGPDEAFQEGVAADA